MVRQAIFFDRDRCIGCYACVIACKLEHNASPYPSCPPEAEPKGINLIDIHHYGPIISEDRVVQFFQPTACRHCTDAPCIAACQSAAIYRDLGTGAVLVDQGRCIGCKSCLPACPFGVPQFDENELMVKCDLCVHRLRKGKPTACAAACVARAILAGGA